MTNAMRVVVLVIVMLGVGCAQDELVSGQQIDVTGDVCLCEGDDCVREWVETNLGCGLCATLVCDERVLSACVLCPDAQGRREAPEEVVIEAGL